MLTKYTTTDFIGKATLFDKEMAREYCFRMEQLHKHTRNRYAIVPINGRYVVRCNYEIFPSNYLIVEEIEIG